jgi:hypothetical protein
MEDVLYLYRLPYDARRPVVCFDVLPVQMLGEVEPLPMKAGKVERFDYEYGRAGTAVEMVAFEPLTGKWVIQTGKQRTN